MEKIFIIVFKQDNIPEGYNEKTYKILLSDEDRGYGDLYQYGNYMGKWKIDWDKVLLLGEREDLLSEGTGLSIEEYRHKYQGHHGAQELIYLNMGKQKILLKNKL